MSTPEERKKRQRTYSYSQEFLGESYPQKRPSTYVEEGVMGPIDTELLGTRYLTYENNIQKAVMDHSGAWKKVYKLLCIEETV